MRAFFVTWFGSAPRSFLVRELVRRDLATRFAGSMGGVAWLLIHPLVLCGLYGFVFSGVLKIAPPAGFPSYAEFLLTGMLPWIGIQDALTRSANSVLDQGHLVKKLAFPTESLVIAALSSAMLVQALGILLLLVWSVATGRGQPNAGALVLAFAFEALLLLGPAFALAAANVFLRDLAQSLGPALMVVLYMTPILYPSELVPQAFSAFLKFNPFADLIALFRAGTFGGPLPGASHLAGWALASIVIAFLGLRLFRRAKTSFSDLL